MINLGKVTKYYKLNEEKIHIFKDISLDVKERDFLIIRGASGSGKTTLLKIIGGLTTTDEKSSVLVSRNDLNVKTQEQLALFRAAYIGFVFQDFHLIPTLNCLENVMLPLELSGAFENEAKEIALKHLKGVGLENRARHFPFQLSGGEQQRTAFARALVNNPAILLADEPTANLDQKTQKFIVEILEKLHSDHDITIIVATHDELITKLGTCILDLKENGEKTYEFTRICEPKEKTPNEE
ncbi:MAG: ABC transporter ATP-binding protein [Candidatus Hodarchaeales archaeon]|jgi:putative ABC transport system ATP-binding protein